MNNYNNTMVETDIIKSFDAFADLQQQANETNQQLPEPTSFGEFTNDTQTFPAL